MDHCLYECISSLVDRHFLQDHTIYSFIHSFMPYHAACGILVPQPGIEPEPLAVKARSSNHWTAREFPGLY